MNEITRVIIWDASMIGDKLVFSTIKIATLENPRRRDTIWTVVAVSKHSTECVGEMISGRDIGFWNLIQSLDYDNKPSFSPAVTMRTLIRELKPERAVIYWPLHTKPATNG